MYAGGELYPGFSLSIGRTRQWLIASEERSKLWYFLFSAQYDMPRMGKLEFFHNLKFVRDNISDNLVQWVQRPGTVGGLQPFDDPLLARNTTINESFVGYTYTRDNLTFRNKFRFDNYHQRGDAKDLVDNTTFVGLINKADYPFKVGPTLTLIPRWKSMWRKRTQARAAQLPVNELSEILSLSAVFPVLTRSRVEVGVETIFFRNGVKQPDPLPPEYVDDFTGKVFTMQYTNRVQYQGYSIIANLGFQVNNLSYVNLKDLNVSNTTAFVELFAGIEDERLGGRPADRRGAGY